MCSLGGRRHHEQPGSRDDAVLVVLRVLACTLTLGARERVVGHVRDAHAAVRAPRRQRVRLRRRRRRRTRAAVAAGVLVPHLLSPRRFVRLERFIVVSAKPHRPSPSRFPRRLLAVH